MSLPTFHFQGQQTNEKILLLKHKHWLLIVYKIIKMLILTTFVSLVLWAIFTIFEIDKLALLILVVSLIFLSFSFFIYFQYQKTYCLITNQRVILSIQRGLFSNKTRSINLNKIHETAFSLNGLFGSIFGFGKLTIESEIESAENRQMTFENIAQVKDSKFFLDKIITLIEEGTPNDQLPIFIEAKRGKRY